MDKTEKEGGQCKHILITVGGKSKHLFSVRVMENLTCHLAAALVIIFRLLGLRISLSRMLTICSNLGLLFLSFCQQSSIN